ncbi:MAG: nitronate monooxygenase [Gammaproteobacteria bacterium]
MYPTTAVTSILKIALPIIQAPMAGATTPELVAAVSNAGGLGSLGAGYMHAEELRAAIKKIRSLTNKPFAINLFIPEKHSVTDAQLENARKAIQTACIDLGFNIPSVSSPFSLSFEDQIKIIFDEKVPVFNFTFGLLENSLIKDFHKKGVALIGTATTLKEAIELEKSDIDIICAQGSEAGGHRGTFIGPAEKALIDISSLTSALSENVKAPIIAAGGIMDAKDILRIFTLGASAVQMGTAFLCCDESAIHSAYKKLLLQGANHSTTLTRAFSGKLARGLNNQFIKNMQLYENEIVAYPVQNALTNAMRKEAKEKNNTDYMSMWAGENASLCQTMPAADLVSRLDKEIRILLKKYT